MQSGSPRTLSVALTLTFLRRSTAGTSVPRVRGLLWLPAALQFLYNVNSLLYPWAGLAVRSASYPFSPRVVFRTWSKGRTCCPRAVRCTFMQCPRALLDLSCWQTPGIFSFFEEVVRVFGNNFYVTCITQTESHRQCFVCIKPFPARAASPAIAHRYLR